MTRTTDQQCQWTGAEIRKGITKFLPACPYEHAQQILKIISRQFWQDIRLSKLIEQVTGNYVRHNLTDYDALIDNHELTPDEARIAVEAEVRGTLQEWRQRH